MNGLKYFCLAGVFFICFSGLLKPVYSQNKKEIDSLHSRLLNSGQDTAKINLLVEIGDLYENELPDSAMYYYNLALSAAIKTNSKKHIANCLRNIGISYYDNGKYEEAGEFYKKSLKIYEELEDKNKIARCYNNIGIAQKAQGEYDKAMENFYRALAMGKEIGDKRGMALSYYCIASIHFYQGAYDKAIEYSIISLKLYEEIGNKRGMASCYESIGNLYSVMLNSVSSEELRESNFNKALEFFFKSAKINEELNDKRHLCKCFTNIGGIYYERGVSASNKEVATKMLNNSIKYNQQSLQMAQELGYEMMIATCYVNIGSVYIAKAAIESNEKLSAYDYHKAMEFMLKSLKINEKLGFKNAIIAALSDLASISLHLKNYNEGIIYAQKGLEIAKETGILPAQKNIYQLLADIYDTLGNYKMAYKNHILYKQISDSIFNNENSKQIAEIQTKYETEKKEKDIQLLKKENELQTTKNLETIKRKNIIFFFILGSFALIAIAVFVFLMQKRANERVKTEKQLSDLEYKALQLQMNPHFIFNALNTISNFIVNHEIDTACEYQAMFAKLMRRVLENSRAESISLQDEMDLLQYYLDLEKMLCENKFDFSIEADERIDKELTFIAPMLIQPFVENSVIHGIRPKDGKGNIRIRFILNDDYILCEIEDDGVGFLNKSPVKSNVEHKSFATQITSDRLKHINKNQKFAITYSDLGDPVTGETGTLVSFCLSYKVET